MRNVSEKQRGVDFILINPKDVRASKSIAYMQFTF